jgi:gamma-glutamylcyclotransferase
MSIKTMYFAYGSNLWLNQMARRCPQSAFTGVGSLADWYACILLKGFDLSMKPRKWIINTRGYANIIPSKGDVVHGLVYELTAKDEGKLDGYEGVPDSYIKEIMPIEFAGDGNLREGKTIIDALVYVDHARLIPSGPKTEYIYRMNMGIADGIEKGIPKEYFEKYLRPFIPEVDKN